MNTKITPKYYDTASYDPQTLQHFTYKNHITDPAPSLDPEISFEAKRNFVLVSSANRDRALDSDPASFKIKLPQTFRDVVSANLISGVFPTAGGVGDSGYILLDIPELNHIESTDGNKYFSLVSLQNGAAPGFFNLDKGTSIMPADFTPAKNKLDALTIRLRHPDGSAVHFGNEVVTAAINAAIQTQLTFEIVTRVPKRINIDRNVRTSAFELENIQTQQNNTNYQTQQPWGTYCSRLNNAPMI